MRFLKLLSFTLLLTTFAIGQTWGADVVVTLDNIGAGLTSTANTVAATTDITATGTTDSYTLNYFQCKKQGNAMLLTKNVSPYISNKTAMPSNIKSVEVFINSGAAGKTTYDCAFSTTEVTSATAGIGAVNITGGNSNTFSNLKTGGAINVEGKYFCITLGNANNGQVLKLVITCEGSGGSSTTCAPPTFNPVAGSYEGTQNVTITSTDGATIYYTTDGTVPSTSSSVYSAPIAVSADMTIKAYAVKNGLTDSDVAEAAYTITKGPDVTLDLIDGNWGFPTSSSTKTTSYTNSTTSYQVGCYASNGYYVSGSSYFLIGKKDSYMRLPLFDNAVEKIVVVGNSGGSGNVSFNIYDGDVAVSTSVTSCKMDQTFTIADPEPNKQYLIKVTNANNLQMKQIKIYFGAAPAVAKPTLSGNTPFLTSTSISLGCTTDGATIYYTTDGTDPQTSSTKQVYTDPFELNATTTVKVKANKGDDWSALNSKQFVKVVPISVATALTAIDALADNGEIADQFVSGVISQIDSYNSSYHSITYWISDDGTTTNQLKVYGGLAGVVKSAFESKDDLTVGADVTIFGKLKKYKSGSNITPEFDSNNEIAAYKPLARLAWSADSYTANKGGNNTFPTLTNTDQVTVTYSSDNAAASFTDASDYSTLQLNSVATGVTITASFAGNETLKANSVSYTLNIEENVARGTISFNVDGGEAITSIPDATALPDPLPVPTKAGKNFVKWYTDSEKTTEAVAGAAVTTDITLFAEWRSPYSVTEALAIIENLGNNTGIENDVYVAGIVSTAPTANPSSGRLTYSISIDGTASEEIKVYLGKGLNNAAFNEKTDIDVADQVVVYGKLYKYEKSGDITPEVNTPNYLYSYIRPTTAVTGVTLPETAIVRAGKTIALTATIEPSNATNKNVTWSVTSGTDYAEVDENGVVTGKAEGTATIQVETEDGGFTASCTVTVLAGVNFADGDWMLVTDAAELTANSYVIIAAADYGKAMKPYESGNNCKSKDATKSGSMLEYNSAFGIFEIGDYEIEEVLYKTFQSEDDEKYLFLGSNDNHLKAQTAKNANAAWTITSVSNAGVAVITSKSFNTRTMRFNDNSNLFACYASGQKDISLYKYYAPVPKVIYNKNTDDEVTNMPGVTRAELEGEVYKATISTTVPHRSGYSFSGWKSGETTYNAGEKYTLTADITLNAQWTQLVGHHVTYVATGTAPTDEKLYYEGDKVTLALATGVSNPGYSFAGWNDGTNTYTAGYDEYVMPDNDVTFTAVWSRMSSQKWALVEDVNNIKTDGTEYVIVAAGYDVAMSALIGKIYSTSDVIKNENTKTLTGPESMLKLTFETGSESGKLAIKNGSKYISSTKVKEMTEGDDSFDWEISITDGVAEISSSVGNIRYNKDYPRFTTYASGQQDVALYVKVPMVEISTDVEASALSENTDVVVHSNGTLTVDGDKTLGDLTVENGGKVVLSNKKLTVTNFVIETTMADHKSGQVDGALTTNFEAMGDAYIDITLGAGGTNQQWHAFTVPFPVDVLNGIFDLADNKLQNEVNYAIMDYHGDIRATGKYGWKKIRTTLVPGTFYIMATDGYRTTYRFKKADGAALVAANTKDLHEYPLNGGTDEQHDNGWNGVGNPTLHYGTANQVVQVLNPNTYTYEEFLVGAKNFVVGTPFFVQAAADGTMTFSAEDKTKPYYAPARYSSEEIKNVEVRFGNEEYTDRLYISANEDALSTYETGKDLIKMTMTNTPKVAQIFGNAYNSKLCMVNAPLHNDQAIYSLTLYAPTDGEYTIAIPQVENADIYLTYDNRIIWNIAASEYNCELKAGETNNYGLILRMKAPQVTTGVEQGGVRNGANSVQKIIINDHVYILRGEKLYDVTGKILR